RGGEHDLARPGELVEGFFFLRPELVHPFGHLAAGEARHQPVRVRPHEIGDLRLLTQPRQVLGALQAPEPGPAFTRGVTVQRRDEVDENFRGHDGPSMVRDVLPDVGWTDRGALNHRLAATECRSTVVTVSGSAPNQEDAGQDGRGEPAGACWLRPAMAGR